MDTSKVSPRQLKAISCILSSRSMEEAARLANISRTSLYKWLKDKNFALKLGEERDVLFRESLSLLKQATGRAAAELVGLLGSNEETTRRLAAKEILGLSLRVAEFEELDERISRLEAALEKNPSGINRSPL